MHQTRKAITIENTIAHRIGSSLADADRDGTFLYAFTAFIVSGTKA